MVCDRDILFIEVVRRGNLEQVKALARQGVNPNATDPNYTTALMYAVQQGREDIVEFLLTARVDVNQQKFPQGLTLSLIHI